MKRRFIGVSELAEYLDVSRNTVYGWVFEGRIPYYKFSRHPKFDIDEISEWIERNKIEERT